LFCLQEVEAAAATAAASAAHLAPSEEDRRSRISFRDIHGAGNLAQSFRTESGPGLGMARFDCQVRSAAYSALRIARDGPRWGMCQSCLCESPTCHIPVVQCRVEHVLVCGKGISSRPTPTLKTHCDLGVHHAVEVPTCHVQKCTAVYCAVALQTADVLCCIVLCCAAVCCTALYCCPAGLRL
jgi:hypothetical protein